MTLTLEDLGLGWFRPNELELVKPASGPWPLKIGDRVRLASGGPVMTITALGPPVAVECNGGAGLFPAETLVPADLAEG